MSDQPRDVLEETIGSAVTVDLKGGEVLEGVLDGYDQHLNLVLSADEDTTIIRGDNVVSIHL